MISFTKPDILKELRDTSAPVEWAEDKNGGTTYNLGTCIPGLEWIIVLSQSIMHIYAHLYPNIFWAVMVTLSVCIMAVWLGWRWIKRFLIPIQTMHHQVEEIGQGNLDQKVSVQSENEIGDLGIAFNEMTDSLITYIDREAENVRALAHAKNLALLSAASSKMTHQEIAPENAENIFEPFFTTKGAGGTGLGMPIVKSNVEAHGGTISCKSNPGKGTVFVIRMPI